jgi:hypothetical protein
LADNLARLVLGSVLVKLIDIDLQVLCGFGEAKRVEAAVTCMTRVLEAFTDSSSRAGRVQAGLMPSTGSSQRRQGRIQLRAEHIMVHYKTQ